MKAHQRAYKCYLSLGDLEKSEESLIQARALGDSTANQQLQLIKTLVDMERQIKEWLGARTKYSDVSVFSN